MQRHNGNGRQDRDIRAIRDDYYSTSDYRDSPVGDIFYDRRSPDYRPVDGCPPGLAKKNNGCMPPGLARKAERRYDRADWWDLPNMTDGRYRYYDGNLVRIGDGGRISGYYPLLAGALSPGQRWPNWFRQDPLPSYYQSYYDLGKAQSYRYADNTIYRIDPATQAITTVAALLTGNDIRVGQPMPSGYDVYNVPYNYRDRYRDGPDARYRYSDGYVYRIDPTTQLVQAVIELL
ncbi:hypothetical protein [Croceicoccus hydrothermalis]|uniref:hypothetical protein n=1 Tax=Croceicoccus hydrothermalis TaxID=2867964 RepID=UPI001EFB6819|nr:hypothetical protein [Croceicoccus hydrothermalis]